MSLRPPPRLLASAAIVASFVLTGCGPTTTPTTAASSPAPAEASASAVTPSISPSAPPTAVASPAASTTGFAFAAEDIAAYYASVGYACSAPQPSTTATGYTVRTCQTTDPAGRIRVIGLVADPTGALGNAFASVQGTATEPILAPIDALEPLSGFLGATLGEVQGASLLTWLASHLGNSYSTTTIGPITVATYSAAPDDHSTLYVELADPAYLDAPPAPSP